jgi:hypothetical protein
MVSLCYAARVSRRMQEGVTHGWVSGVLQQPACRIWPMRKLGLSSLLLPFLLSMTLHSQTAPSTPAHATPTLAQYNAALQSVATNEAQWRKIVEAVKVEDLPVSYALGKQFEQNKQLVNEDLKMAAQWASRANSEHSLFAEVSFLSSIQDLQSQVQQFAGLMLEFEMTDSAAQKKVMDWADALSTLANGPMQQAWVASYLYTTNRARLLDLSCSAAIQRQ